MMTRRKLLMSAGALATPGVAGLLQGQDTVDIPDQRSAGSSLWTQESAQMPAMPVLQDELAVDLAIVGGGYSGLACAYYVKKMRPDWRVIVLESHRLGAGASSRNSGAVYAKYVGLDDGGMPGRGLERFRRFIETEAIACDFAPASTLIAHHSSADARQAKKNLAAGSTWVGRDQLREIAGTSYYAGAEDAPGYYKIHPVKLLQGKLLAALKLGVEIYEHSPVQAIRSGKPAILSTPEARVVANNVFIATNAYTSGLGLMRYKMFPMHQYTFASERLTAAQIRQLGLDRWDLRFEPRLLPITFSLTPSGHFFLRIVLGYASLDATEWSGVEYAQALVRKMFYQRYPQMADIQLQFGWHGVTGHTTLFKQIAGPIADGNIHVSVAFNGLGIMPSHNNAYLTACRLAGVDDPDLAFLSGIDGHLPMPRDYYRSMIFKPFMRFAQPV